MERLSKEFTDIDESVTVDEDLMKSLKKRMGKNATDTEGGEGCATGMLEAPEVKRRLQQRPMYFDSRFRLCTLEKRSCFTEALRSER